MFVCLFIAAPPPLLPIFPPDKGAIHSNSFTVKLTKASDENGEVRYEGHRTFQGVKFQHYKIFKMCINRIVKQNWAQVNSTLIETLLWLATFDWRKIACQLARLLVRVDERKKEGGEHDKAREWACKHFLHTSARPLLCPLPGIKMSNAKMCGVGGLYTPCSFDSARAWGIACPSILFLILLVLNAYTVVLSSC